MADTAKISNQVSALRKTYNSGKTRSIAWRQEQLRALKRFVREREKELYGALAEDLGKGEFEALTAELAMVLGEANLSIKKLPKWTRPKKVPTVAAALPGKSYMVPEPQGLALIIGAWNYPVQLALVPLVGAIAGGNCAVIKPSEVAPATSKVLAQHLPNYLDKDAFAVIEGAVEETTALLEEKFDHYFYTGNGRVGSIVMSAAARHLGQVTLELGGKSPCIVDHTADLDVAAKRIAWGKFYNAGQTCVAPDYVMVEKDVEEPLLANLRDALKAFYGEDPQQSPDYCRIVNERHHDRLTPLLESGEVYVGGEADKSDRYIAPTVLRNVPKDSAVMEDEIFGPILPVLSVSGVDEAIDYVNSRPKPLALYAFSSEKQTQEKIIRSTSSGGVTINHIMMHVANTNLPFGGVGPSGQGGYHGKASFECFTHMKPVMKKGTFIDPPILYPPYTEGKFKWIKRLL